jgi:putative molybdopterin biosynthesis protein
VLTVQEAAAVVKLTQWAIYRAIQRGDLVAYKPGGRLRINESDLQAWLKATRVRPASTAPAAPARTDPPPELIGPSGGPAKIRFAPGCVRDDVDNPQREHPQGAGS